MTSFQVAQRLNFAAFGVITAFESYIAVMLSLNPNCSGLRMLWIWIYLFNLWTICPDNLSKWFLCKFLGTFYHLFCLFSVFLRFHHFTNFLFRPSHLQNLYLHLFHCYIVENVVSMLPEIWWFLLRPYFLFGVCWSASKRLHCFP